MTSDLSVEDRAADEATTWFARLNTNRISSQTLSDFHAWRRAPENDRAYRKIERLWSRSSIITQDPAVQAELDAALERARRAARRSKPHWALAASGGAGIVAVGLGLAAITQLGQGQTYTTGIGEQRTIALSDGSTIRLDTDSQITVRISPTDRSVKLLKGQAFFDVVHEPNRAFHVQAGYTSIRDLGTRFDVRRVDGDAQVTLVDGMVQVSDQKSGEAPWTLRAGQQILTGPRAAPRSVDPASVTSWTMGRLIFNDVPLAAAAAEVNRYAKHRVVIGSPDVGAIRISGTFDNDRTDDFIAAVAKLYDLATERQANGSVVLSATNAPPPS